MLAINPGSPFPERPKKKLSTLELFLGREKPEISSSR
jgi:hypothetical protein